MTITTEDYLKNLLIKLASLSNEEEWLEFKVNNIEPIMIGEYISALSNSAALIDREKAYLIWGIDDKTHEIVGTNFNFKEAKKGSEELVSWLSRMLTPRINFEFNEVFFEDKKTVILIIDKASRQPTQFAGQEFIRIGTNKKKLREYPEKERELWRAFDDVPYELKIASENNSIEEIFSFLDTDSYYKLLDLAIPKNREKIIEDLINEKFIKRNDASLYDITNLGAILIAKNVSHFENLTHKYIRVIWYKDNTKLETIREERFNNGYAIAYENVIKYIMTIIPQKEIIEGAIRKVKFDYPEIAIREIVSNIIVHQAIEKREQVL